MSKIIKIKNLTMLFGQHKEVEEARKMLNNGIAPSIVKEKTNVTIALNNVSFDIEKNELFVIVGLSGSGKSTLIRCINLLNQPTQGDVIIEDINITKLNRKQLIDFRRNKVSMVFQHFGLLNHRSVMNNVEYGLEVKGIDKKERKTKALEALNIVGLMGWENKKPKELSGGMKQRVGLARALVTGTEILLMDEPYSALDPLIRRDMQNELLNLEDAIDRTIVFITHDMNEAFKIGDRVALMKDGEIVQIGSPKEFFESPASEYVRDFIRDVDKTQIFKVKSILNKNTYCAKITDSRLTVLSNLDLFQQDICFVTDSEGLYIGMIRKEDISSSKKVKLDSFIHIIPSIHRHSYIKDCLSSFDEYQLSCLPVATSKLKYQGVITKDDVIKMLA